MQQLRPHPLKRSLLRLAPCAGLALCLLGEPVLAQNGTGAKPTPPAAADPQADLPILFLAEQRTADTTIRRDDPNPLLKETLRKVFIDSGKFKVFTFSPTAQVLKAALNNHYLTPEDLNEPLKPEALHKMARLYGARNILAFRASLDKTGMKTNVTMEEVASQTDWHTMLTQEFFTEPAIGKRRLKMEEIVAVAADAIAKSLDIPSHLTDDLNLNKNTKVFPAPADPKKTPRAAKTSKTDGPAKTAKTDGGANPVATTTPDDPPTNGAGTTTPPTGPPQTPEEFGVAQKLNGKGVKTNGKPPKSSGNPPRDSVAGLTSIGKLDGDRLVGESAVQTKIITAPSEVVENISNADRATRYREAGDLANTIRSLRHAIDDKPDDINLRGQLIQTYQESGMMDLTLAEISRALLIAPANSGLYRLYGEALTASGHSAEAEKAFKEAIRLDPNDDVTRVSLGDSLLQDGKYADAIQAYQDAAAGNPKSPLPHRRLARAACQRAASDMTQYTACLDEIKKARSLTTPGDTEVYLGDYATLMRLLQSRLEDILDQLDNTYAAYGQGQTKKDEALRLVDDMKQRASAASDFLDALPPAAGHDGTQALYQQGTASVLEALLDFKSFVSTNDRQSEDKLKIARMSARHDLTNAGKHLPSSHPAKK